MQNSTNLTLNHLIDQSFNLYKELPAVGFAFEESVTYEIFHNQIMLTAANLKKSGIKKGDRIAILAENSPQWGIAYFGIVRLGAIAIPILSDFPESDVKHILDESKVRILFTTQKQFEKLYELDKNRLETIITLDDAPDKNRIIFPTPFSKFLTGTHDLPENQNKNNNVSADDIASIIYTSGTSGHSKAVMLTHNNFLNNVRSTEAIFANEPLDHWTFLSILPMSHAYEFTISFLTPLANGCRIVYANKTPTPTVLEKICKIEQPAVMCMVPMIMEKIYKKKVLPKINNNIILKTAIKVPMVRKQILKKIGKNLCNFFGGKLKIAAIGGAPLNIEVEKFLKEAGFPYLVGYGLTEASPLISGGPYDNSTIPIGSCGKPIQGVTVKIVQPNPESGVGEVYAKGQNIMRGYMNNKRATAEVIDAEGWLATGDLGYLDKQGYLFLKGRSKSVIVLSHGENIYPETIEEKINSFQHVIESLVLECNNHLEAKVFLDYELIDQETRGKKQQKKLSYIKEILAHIKKTVNSNLPKYSQLSEVEERQEPFTKTATHKIKRYLYHGAKE